MISSEPNLKSSSNLKKLLTYGYESKEKSCECVEAVYGGVKTTAANGLKAIVKPQARSPEQASRCEYKT